MLSFYSHLTFRTDIDTSGVDMDSLRSLHMDGIISGRELDEFIVYSWLS